MSHIITYNGELPVLLEKFQELGFGCFNPTNPIACSDEALIKAIEDNFCGEPDGSCTAYPLTGEDEYPTTVFITDVDENKPFMLIQEHYGDLGSSSSIISIENMISLSELRTEESERFQN